MISWQAAFHKEIEAKPRQAEERDARCLEFPCHLSYPSPMKPDRNAPCPCGSGKKYKKCCLLKEQTSDLPLSHELLHQACGRAVGLLSEYAAELYPSSKLLSQIINQYMPVLENEESRRHCFEQLMMPWLLYLWHPGKTKRLMSKWKSAQELPSPKTIAARFLEENESKDIDGIDGIARRYIESARREPLIYWQVVGVNPGSGLLLKDLVTEREVFVHDVASSNSMNRWDFIFAQVAGYDDNYILNALGLYSLPPFKFNEPVMKFVEVVRKGIDFSGDPLDVLPYHMDFLLHYQRAVHEILNPVLPKLTNTDGDDLVWTTSKYSFDPADREEVVGKLKKIRNIDFDIDEDGVANLVWMGKAKVSMPGGRVSRGTIKVHARFLKTECNSTKRDRTLRKLIEKHLGSLISHESTEEKELDPSEMMKRAPGEPKESGLLDINSLPEESRKQLIQMFEDNYMKWADEVVPRLGGKTPREAVKSPEGKKEVAAMIAEWENMSRRSPNPQFEFDFNKLRRELGVDIE